MDFYICGNPLCRKIEFRLPGDCYSCRQNTYPHDPTIEELQPKVADAQKIAAGLYSGDFITRLRWSGEHDFTAYLENLPVERARHIAASVLSQGSYGNFMRVIWPEPDEKTVRASVTLN